jgi:hypothetical protein
MSDSRPAAAASPDIFTDMTAASGASCGSPQQEVRDLVGYVREKAPLMR